MTLEQWIEKYNSKVDIKFVRDERYELFYLPEHGFMELAATKDLIIVNNLCGDIRYLKDKIDEIARAMHIPRGVCYCLRKEIRAYIKLIGFKVYFEENTKDGIKYYGIDKYGRTGTASPAYKIGDYRAYFITWQTGG